MAFTDNQAAIWQQIARAYNESNPGSNRLMPVKELSALLPAVAPEFIGNTLAQAASDGLAEVGSIGENPEFRPLTSGR